MPGCDKPICKYCKSQAEAVKKLKELYVAEKTNTFIKPIKMTLGEWLDYWMESYVLGEVSPTWYARKHDIIRLHIKPGLGDIRLQKVTPLKVQQFYKRISSSGKQVTGKNVAKNESTGLSNGSIRHIHNILKLAFDRAVEDGLLGYNDNPMLKVKPPKVVKEKKARPLNEAALTRYLVALQGERLYAAIILDLCSGLKRGELIALHRTDLNRDTRVLTVQRKISKVKNKNGSNSLEYSYLKTERSVVLPVFAINALDEHIVCQDKEKQLTRSAYQDEGLIFCTAFGQKLDPRSLYEIHCRALRKAGLDKSSFNDLRYTFETLLHEKGEDLNTIQEMLGQAN